MVSQKRSGRFLRSRCLWAVGIALLSSDLVLLSNSTGKRSQHEGRAIYVAPHGLPTNDGSEAQPIDLATALGPQSPAGPGHTIWLRGGTYRGTFVSSLVGTPLAPIIVRQYPGERATIDSATGVRTQPALTVKGSDAWYWGFEVTDTNPARTTMGEYSPALRAASVSVFGPRTRFINMIVHDGGHGFGFWESAVDAELYGNLIYQVGVDAPDGGHGHSIDVRNSRGTKRIVNNVLFNSFGMGIHADAGDGRTHFLRIEGNTAFNNGVMSRTGRPQANLYLGGNAGPDVSAILDNYFYYSQFDNNNHFSTPPVETETFVRRNAYEPGRASLTIYNWSGNSSISVDLVGSGLEVGDRYEIRDAQNYFGAPVTAGTYTGDPITLPMTNLTVADPVGDVPIIPVHTGPEFGVFILLKISGAVDSMAVSTTTPTEGTLTTEIVRDTDASATAENMTTVATPTFTPNGGTFTDSVTVAMACATCGASIRYTTDGTTPTSSSTLYVSPITLTTTRTINARGFKTGLTDSAVATATFTIQSSQIAQWIYPTHGQTNVDLNQLFRWTSVTGAQAYYLYVGSTRGANNLVNTGEIQQTSMQVTGLPLSVTVYGRLWTKHGGIWRFADADFIVTTAGPTQVAQWIYPTHGQTNVNLSQAFSWTSVPGAQAYYLYVGSTRGANDLVNSGEIQQTSMQVAGLPLGVTVYGRLWTKHGGVWRFVDADFIVTTGSSQVAQWIYPTHGQTNVNLNLPFRWTSVTGAQAYYLYVGSTRGANNLVNTGETLQTSMQVTGLPLGVTVYGRLWTKHGGIWRFVDADFIVITP